MMAILEISPFVQTTYTMPKKLFHVVWNIARCSHYTINEIYCNLKPEYQDKIKVESKKRMINEYTQEIKPQFVVLKEDSNYFKDCIQVVEE